MDKERSKATHKRRELSAINNENFLQEDLPALSYRWNHETRSPFKELDFERMDGEIITFRARIHTLRRMSAKLVFIVFCQQTITIQGVLQSSKPNEGLKDGKGNAFAISEQMIRSVERYPSETIVVVSAKLRKAPRLVKNATIHDYEFEVYGVHRVGDLIENAPFTVYDAENMDRDIKDVEVEDKDGSSLFLSYREETSSDAPRNGASRISQHQAGSIYDKLASQSKNN